MQDPTIEEEQFARQQLEECREWAAIYAIERLHEPEGFCGSVSSSELLDDDRVKVIVWWGSEDQIPQGGEPVGGKPLTGSHYRKYVVEITTADQDLAAKAVYG